MEGMGAGDRQTDLNSYPAYKLGVLRERTYTSLYFFAFLITFHIN